MERQLCTQYENKQTCLLHTISQNWSTFTCFNQSLPVIDQCWMVMSWRLTCSSREYNIPPLCLIRCMCLFLQLTEEGWVKHIGGRGRMDSTPTPHIHPLPAALCTSGCLKTLYCVEHGRFVNKSASTEADNLYSSSLTACRALCGEGSVPLQFLHPLLHIGR